MIIRQNYKEFLSQNFDPANCFVITDQNLYEIYGDFINKFNHFVVKPGEISKSFETVQQIIERLVDLNLSRKSVLIGFGGGVVCDLTGFVASIYKRGVRHSFIPTSLLAMVDAAYGGKTAINFSGIKNLVGTFKDAELINIDISLLDTLPHEHFTNAMAEVIKTALVGDVELYEYLLAANPDSIDIDRVIQSCLEFKLQIVEHDMFDTGMRQILNFGHTFGHAFEAQMNIHHGQAVAMGIEAAIFLSENLSDIDKNHILGLLNKYKLGNYAFPKFSEIKDFLNNDKKISSKIKFVLLKKIGNPYIAEYELQEIEEVYDDLRINRNRRQSQTERIH